MKKKQKLFLGFTVMTITVIFTMAGCALLQPVERPNFSSELTGTWERVDQSKGRHTLTFTSTTLKASNQNYYWNLRSISGTVYNIRDSLNGSTGTIHLTLNGDTLDIVDAYDMSNAGEWSGTEDDWTGTWRRR